MPGWIVLGAAAVVVDAERRAGRVGGILCPILLTAIANRKDQRTIAGEDDARAVVAARAYAWRLSVDRFAVDERRAIKPGAVDGGRTVSVRTRRRIRVIEPTVRAVVWMHDNIETTARTVGSITRILRRVR